MYLKNKKLAVIAHGMADPKSWNIVISWFQSICTWEKSIFSGSFSAQSSSRVGGIELNNQQLEEFISNLIL